MSARPRSASYQRLVQQSANSPPLSPKSAASSSTTSEENLESDFDNKKKSQNARQTRAERISDKLHAILWIAASGCILYFLDFFHTAFTDKRVSRLYFNIGLVCFGINCCITFYLAVWLPYIQKITLEWSVYCPRMIPAATGFGVLATFGFIFGLWPIWGLFTPGILFTLFVGFLMTGHFLPAI